MRLFFPTHFLPPQPIHPIECPVEVINKLFEKNISKITFALVDKTVPVDQKGELSDIISSITRPQHFPPGKPVFPGPKFVDLVEFWPESGELPRVAKLDGEKS